MAVDGRPVQLVSRVLRAAAYTGQTARLDTRQMSVSPAEGRFALGNAQAQNHAYEKAIETYDEVLKAQPDNIAAKTNRAIVLAALKAQEEKRPKQEEADTLADETRNDQAAKGRKRIRVNPQDVTTAGAAEAWMREVQTTPADFLKLKFAIQAAASPAPVGPAR